MLQPPHAMPIWLGERYYLQLTLIARTNRVGSKNHGEDAFDSISGCSPGFIGFQAAALSAGAVGDTVSFVDSVSLDDQV